jgi:hypothetical protein
MLIRFIIVLILFSACRSGEIICPEVKSVKLRKKPGHYIRTSDKEVTASVSERRPVKMQSSTRKVKTISSIEEWDCPRPGAKVIPRSVKDNIKKNRKKFDDYNRNRSHSDSTASTSAQGSLR